MLKYLKFGVVAPAVPSVVVVPKFECLQPRIAAARVVAVPK